MLQAERSRVRVPIVLFYLLIYILLPDALWPWSLLIFLTEMSTRNHPVDEWWPARKA
jgi:hypothetical protein